MHICYVLTFVKDGISKIYVGRTSNFERRLKRHLKELKDNLHHNVILQTLFNEGWVYNNKPKIFVQLNKKEATETEKYLISKYQTSGEAVNIENGGDTLTHHPDKKNRIKRMTESVIKRFMSMSPEERKALGRSGKLNGMFGRNHTDKSKELISEKIRDHYKDHHGWALGKKFTDAHKAKISENAKKRTGSKNPFYGKSHSQETLTRLREINIGKLPPNIKRCSINGVIYETASAAARALSIKIATLTHRLRSKSPKYATWYYLNAQRPERECSYDASALEKGEGL